MFEYTLVGGLVASGADAYLLHVTTTPSVAYVARTEDFDCGIMISASHNPYEHNGIKLFSGQGYKLFDELEERIEDLILSGEPLYIYEEKLTLEDGFFKCSRSFIVNINRIDTFTSKEIYTHSGARISISRNLHREFENAYFAVLFGKDGDIL